MCMLLGILHPDSRLVTNVYRINRYGDHRSNNAILTHWSMAAVADESLGRICPKTNYQVQLQIAREITTIQYVH